MIHNEFMKSFIFKCNWTY